MGKTMHRPVIMMDFGGVYFKGGGKHGAKKWSKRLKIPEEEIFRVLVGDDWTKWATGKIGADTYWNAMAAKLKVPKEGINDFKKDCHTCIPNQGMRELVRKIRRRYRVVVLSGNVRERIEILERQYKINREFHEQHYSFDHGYDKPDVRLFISAARKMNLKAADCSVIDDDKIFLQKVAKKGAREILVKNARQVESQLRKMGVEI
jgi:FMN phosphatase YigB (HAD superfamily)